MSGRGRIGDVMAALIKSSVAAVLLWLAGSGLVFAQTPASPPPDPLMQLMLTQPAIEISTNAEVRVEFDPPVIGRGEQATYRVSINAVSDSVRWPDDVYAPMELVMRQSARGQVLQPAVNQLKPMTMINYRVTPTKPGSYVVPEFRIKVYGQNVTVPAAKLEVLAQNPGTRPMRQLRVELAETNVFVGQPVKVFVFMEGGSGNTIQVLNQVQINGDGIMVDQTSVRQRIQTMEFQGRTGPVFVYEAVMTPLVAGRINLSAQGFTAGNQFQGNLTIQGQAVIPGGQPNYVLLDSGPIRLEVEPLPRTGELPGFTGAIGEFTVAPPRLSTNRVQVGEAVKLIVTFQSEGEVKRLNPPPPPAVTNWQIFPAKSEGGPTLMGTVGGISTALTYSYTLIPLTNDMQATPAIPLCYFDPRRKIFVDASISPVPIEVVAGRASAVAQALAQAAAATKSDKLTLSDLAARPGSVVGSLIPLQMRGAFWLGQLVPLLGFAGLWFWDRQRRFYEAHPEVLVRKRARRALRRERAAVERAARANDATQFAASAVAALRAGAAPHFPATPRALVGRDVLELLESPEQSGRAGEVVQQLFAATDARQYSSESVNLAELLATQPDLLRILARLEERLK